LNLPPLRCEHVGFAVLLLEVAAMFRTNWLFLAAVGFLVPGQLHSEGLPSSEPSSEPCIRHIAAWIERLDCPAYSERQTASQRLEDAGAAALAELESAIVSGSREASGRALDILKRHFETGAEDLKMAAQDVLVRLAGHTSASTAQRARNILNPPREANMAGPMPVGLLQPMPGRGNFVGGPPANPGFFRRISVSDINGRRTIDIDERERRIILATAPRGGIEVEVTDKQNRRNPTRVVSAKDLDELKRKDPELGRLYEQHGGGGQLLPADIGPRIRALR
jgi:hypothetical protein